MTENSNLTKVNIPGLQELFEKVEGLDYKIVETTLLHTPTEEFPTVVVKKTVRVGEQLYSALDDASAATVDECVKCSLVSMADTRALVRALRFATRTARTAWEELRHDGKDRG